MAYSQANLNQRKEIIEGQKQLVEFLDAERFNKLVHVFDEKVEDEHNILRYIEEERRQRGLSSENVTMDSFVYGYNRANPGDRGATFIVTIKKGGINYVHLSIHIAPRGLEPKDQGIIHLYKDVYGAKLKKGKKHPAYTLVHVSRSPDKPNSLHFYRTDGDVTDVDKSKGDYDADLSLEMDILLSVLNRMFDEDDKDHYIGESDILYPIHNKTNNVLKNVNQPNTILKRRNTGKLIMPTLQNNFPSMSINRRRLRQTARRRNNRANTSKKK